MGGRGGSSGSKGGGGGQAANSQLNNPLVKGLPESEQGDFYYHHDAATAYNILRDGTRKAFIMNADAISTNNVLVNINYPKITGTEKQINYAKNLITKQLTREIRNAMDFSKGKEKAFIESAKKYDSSVKTYSDAINLTLKMKKSGVLTFIKSNSTARAIIDKYGY